MNFDTHNFSLHIISSITLFLISFFYIFWIGSYFEVDIFPVENRAIYYTTFNVYIFDKYVDAVIITLLTVFWLFLSIRGTKRIVSSICYGGLTAAALFTNVDSLLDISVLVSIPLLSSFFIIQHFSTKKTIQIQTNSLVSYFSFAVLFIAISGAVVSILTLSSTTGFPVGVRNYSIDIFLLFSAFSPALIIFLVVGSIIKLVTIKGVKELKNKTFQHQIIIQKVKQKSKFLFLSLFMFLSIFFVLLPHQSFINNENELVGADTVDYVKWLDNIRTEDSGELMYRAFAVQNSGDRPLSFLFFSAILSIFPENPYQIIDHIPIIFSPLLVLTVFFLTRELTSNDTVSLLASFLTAISFQPLIGIYAGLYANWLALIVGYLSFIFLIRFLKRPTGINYLVYSVLLFLIMFSHLYTWTVLTLFIGIFLIVSCWLKIFERKRVALIFLIIVASIAFDVGKSIMIDKPFGIERDVIIASTNVNFGDISTIWSNLSQTSLVYAVGLFGNFLILSLCIYWLLRSNLREMPHLFIAVFLSIGILPILVGNELIQSRVFYDISFQIPAAIGLAYLAKLHKGTIFVIATSIWILTMSIQSITNFI